jgi:DNA-binding XRE family transcriptional regulator
MPRRSRVVECGAERGRANTIKLAHELRSGRVDRGLTQQELARAVGISRSRESYIERGLVRGASIARWSELLAVVGLELSVQTFPTGQPIRDAAHAAFSSDCAADSMGPCDGVPRSRCRSWAISAAGTP